MEWQSIVALAVTAPLMIIPTLLLILAAAFMIMAPVSMLGDALIEMYEIIRGQRRV